MLTREQPWHLRRTTAKQEQAFRNLVDFNEITTAWLSELRSDRPQQLLSRGLSADVTENLWMLESLASKDATLASLLDDTRPQDTLARLDYTIWAVQAWTWAGITEKTPKSDLAALESQLNQISWKAGRSCSERRWKQIDPADRQDLNLLAQAVRDTPVLGSAEACSLGDPLLIRRAVPNELLLELRFCPHQSPYPEVRGKTADALCALHGQWMRGFAYGLNSRIGIETGHHAGERCLQRWFFL